MQEIIISAEQLAMIVIAVMVIIICWACCRSSNSGRDEAIIIANQDIVLKSINGQIMTIGYTIDRIEGDVDYLKGKVNKIDEYIDNQSKQ